MASIRRKVTIRAPAHKVWDAMRDVGALHTRLVVGFVTDCRLEGDTASFVAALAGLTVHDLVIEPARLEEAFLEYYAEDGPA